MMPKELVKKHPLAVRWFHWINFPVLVAMIWSGLLIYWANDVYRIGWGNVTVIHFFPDRFYHMFHLDQRLAEGMAWHFLFFWIFTINGACYVLYNLVSGEWREIVPKRTTFREAIHVVLHDLHLTKVPPPRRKFNGAQQIAYTGIIAMGAGSLLTGLAIYRPVQLSWLTTLLGGYGAARFEHFWLMMGFCAFFVVHVGQVVKTGWNNFRAMVTGYEIVKVESRPPTPTEESAVAEGAPS